jgi:hypothetical protein
VILVSPKCTGRIFGGKSPWESIEIECCPEKCHGPKICSFGEYSGALAFVKRYMK